MTAVYIGVWMAVGLALLALGRWYSPAQRIPSRSESVAIMIVAAVLGPFNVFWVAGALWTLWEKNHGR